MNLPICKVAPRKLMRSGMTLIAFATLLKRFYAAPRLSPFLQGAFTGLGLLFLLTGSIRRRREQLIG